MSEMVDRVAKAIASQHGVSPDPDRTVGHGEYAHPYWAEFVDHAIAAIEAMRLPTKDMNEAGFQAGSIGDGGDHWEYADPAATYMAMISEALK